MFTLTVADRICIIACCDFLKAGFHIIAPIYPGDHYGDYTEIRLYGIKVVPPQSRSALSPHETPKLCEKCEYIWRIVSARGAIAALFSKH